MNKHKTNPSLEDGPKSLTFAEKRELLSKEGATAARVAHILWLKSPVTLASMLKKMQRVKHYNDRYVRDNVRFIMLTKEGVRTLLEKSAPTKTKKAKSPENNIVQILDKPGMVFADFQQEMRKFGYTTINLGTVWNYLTKTYPKYFSPIHLKEGQKPANQLKPEWREEVMTLAKEYADRKGRPWQKNTSAPARRTSIR